MKTFIIGLIFIVSPLFAFGHNPLSAKYHLEAGEQVSLLTINLSQDGVNQVLLKKYGNEKLESMTQNEFKELIVEYVKSNFSLSFDKKEIALREGGVKLGSHQTDLKFVLPPISSEVEKMVIHISAFKENDNHQTIFSYHIKGSTEHVILNLQNNYQSTKMFPTSGHTTSWLWFFLTGLVILISVLL